MSNEKSKTISAQIIALTLQGKTVKEAFDTVLGAGAFEKLAGEIYETLRK